MVLQPPLTQAQIDAAALRVKNENYIQRLLVQVDDTFAAAADIQNDQTISSQVLIDARNAHKDVVIRAFATVIADGLDLIQKSHSEMAQVGDVVRAQEVIATDTAALKAETGTP